MVNSATPPHQAALFFFAIPLLFANLPQMSITVIVFTFFSMTAFAVLMWTIVQKQERDDPEFEEKLAADDRRARANRQAAAKAGHPGPLEQGANTPRNG